MDCPDCRSIKIETKWVEEAFDYGDKDPVSISVKIPVRTCKDCGLEFTDEVMEQVRDDAAQTHLKTKEKA